MITRPQRGLLFFNSTLKIHWLPSDKDAYENDCLSYLGETDTLQIRRPSAIDTRSSSNVCVPDEDAFDNGHWIA